MKNLTYEADHEMRWIYDSQHPDYNTDHARSLRAARARALLSAPIWMKREAALNEIMDQKA